MIIERIAIRVLALGLRSPFNTAFGVIHARPLVIVEMQAGGITGLGECPAFAFPGYTAETVETAVHVLRDVLAPPLRGRSVTDVRRLMPPVRGHPMSHAALELAAWDILGQASDTPLAAMLGGTRSRVPVGVALGRQQSTEALVEAVRMRIDQGYGRIKVKIAHVDDVAGLRRLREAFPDLPLQTDANGSLDPADMDAIAALDGLGLVCLEQPFEADDLVSHATLQARIATPILLDESITSVNTTRTALHLGACRAVSVKQACVGGLHEALAIHDLCVRHGVPLLCGGMLSSNIGRAADLALASLPGFTLPGDISASARYFVHDPTQPDVILNADSTIDVPAAPGLGVRLDPEAVEACTERLIVV